MATEYGIGVKVNVDRAQIRQLAPEMEQVAARVKKSFAEIGGGQMPGAMGRLEQSLGMLSTGRGGRPDVAQARQAVAELLRIHRGYYQELRRLGQQEVDEMRRQARQTFEVRMEAAGGMLGGPERQGIRRGYRQRLQEIRDVQRAAERAMTADVATERGGLAQLGTALPTVEAARQGGGGRFGWGGFLGRGAAGGPVGQFFRGLTGVAAIGGLGYFAARRVMATASREIDVYDLAARIAQPDEFLGQGKKGRDDFDEFRKRVQGIPFLSPTESRRAVDVYSSQAGAFGAEGRASGAAQLGLGFGVGAEGGAQFFGGLARLIPNVGHDQHRFALMIGEAVAQAQMRGREGEAFASIEEFVQLAMRTMTGGPDLSRILDLQLRLVGGARTEEERRGLQGQLGMRVLGTAHEAIAGTQLFDLPQIGRPLMLAAMMRAGVTDPYEMQRIVSRGLLGELPGGQPLWESMLDEGERLGLMQMGGGLGKLALAQVVGQGAQPEHFDSLLRARGAGGFGNVLSRMPSIQAMLAKSPHRLPGMISVLSRYLEGKGALTPETAGGPTIVGGRSMAGLLGNPRELRALEAEMLGYVGVPPTGPEELRRSAAKAEQNLEETFTTLVPVVEKFTAALAIATDLLNRTARRTSEGLEQLGISPEGAVAGVGLGALLLKGLRVARGALPGAGLPSWAGAATRFSLGVGTAALGGYWAGTKIGEAITPQIPESARPVLPLPQGIDELVRERAAAEGISPALVQAMIAVESAGDPGATSRKGARGLMQLMPETARRLGFDPEQLYDPAVNVQAGTTLLGQLLRKYGDPEQAIAAYHAGEPAVDRALQRGSQTGTPWQQLLRTHDGSIDTMSHVGKVMERASAMTRVRLPEADEMFLRESRDIFRGRLGVEIEPLHVYLHKPDGETEFRLLEPKGTLEAAGTFHGETTSPVAE